MTDGQRSQTRQRGRGGIVIRTLDAVDRRLGLVLLAGVAIRLLWLIHNDALVHPRTWEYTEAANNLISGRGYVVPRLGTDWHTLVTPTYPLILAGLELLGGGIGHQGLVMITQIGLSAALIALTFELGRMMGGRATGLLGASVIAVHPALVLYNAEVHELILDAVLLSASLLLLLRFGSSADRSGRSALALGALGALSALTRATLGAFALLGLLFAARQVPRWPAIAAALLALVGILAWPVENRIVTGTSPAACFYLWVGNNPATAFGGSTDRSGTPVVETGVPPLNALRRATEAEEADLLCDAAVTYISADPVGAFARWGSRSLYFFIPSPVEGRNYPAGFGLPYRAGYLAELTLACVGLYLCYRGRGRALVPYIIILTLSVAMTQSFFYVEGRHRLLLEPAFACLAALSVQRLVAWSRVRMDTAAARVRC